MGDDRMKPCPFCDSDEGLTVGETICTALVRWWSVACHGCNVSNTASTEAEAIAAWNTRPAASARGVADQKPKRGDKIKWARALDRRPLAVRDLESVTIGEWGLPGMPLVCTLQEVAGTFPMGWFDRELAAPSSPAATPEVERGSIQRIVRDAVEGVEHVSGATDRILALFRAPPASAGEALEP